MKTIRPNDPGVLANWQDDWVSSGYTKTIRSYCAYEIRDTYGVRIVRKESATSLCMERYDPLDRDHIAIVKPTGVDDDVYLAFKNAYNETFGRPSLRGLFEDPRGRPTWNLVAYDHALLRIRNETRGTFCDDCQGTSIGAAPGDLITVTLHYRNDSEAVARNTRLRLSVPSEPFRGAGTIAATISGDETLPAYGKVAVNVEGTPIILVPVGDAEWYVNKSAVAASLPNDEGTRALLSGQGLLVGDVNPGAAAQADIMLRFRCTPVVARAIKNAFRIVESRVDTGDDIDEQDVISAAVSAAETICGNLERNWLSSPAWVDTVSELRADDDLSILVSHYNAEFMPLKNVKIFVRPHEENPEDLHIEITAGGEVVASSIVHLKFGSDARTLAFLMAARYSSEEHTSLLGFLASTEMIHGDPDRGLLVGDIGPRSAILTSIVFIVASDRNSAELPNDDDRALIAESLERNRRAVAADESVRTTLNADPDDTTLLVASPGLEKWADHYDQIRVGDRLQFRIHYRVSAHAGASGLHSRMTFEQTDKAVLAYAQLTATNADPVTAAVNLDCGSVCAHVGLKFVGAQWYYFGKPAEIEVDVAALATTGVWLGDRPANDTGWLVLHYVVVEPQGGHTGSHLRSSPSHGGNIQGSNGEQDMPGRRDETVAAIEAPYLRFAPKMYRVAIRNFGVPPADAAEIVQAIFELYFTQADEVENDEAYLLAGVCQASRKHLAPPGADVPSFCGETPCLARREPPPASG
jgi:hypothetical protein